MFQRSYSTLSLCAIVLLAGCKTTPPVKPLSYRSETPMGVQPLRASFHVGDFVDMRPYRELDVLFEDTAIEEIERVLRDRLTQQSSNSVAESFQVSGILHSLDWEVPDYGAMIGKAMTVSFLTGGLGGIVYGATTTPVLGKIDIEYIVKNEGGSTMFSKRYEIVHEDSRKKFSSDTPETKSEMASEALSQSIDQFIADLAAIH